MWFTIASSPTEEDLRLGIKFYPDGSSYKHALSSMISTDTIVASQLAGDFVLPNDPKEKLVFIAGGIGVTPFRSMIKYLVDRHEKRSVTLLYCCKTTKDIAYKDVFDAAEAELGIKTTYITSILDAKMIAEEVPDFKDRTFYLSGPHGMVSAFDQILKKMGVPGSRIKKDFFPGFA